MIPVALGIFVMALLIFGGGLIATGTLTQMAGGKTVTDPKALVFEVYRYTVCFIAVIAFAISAQFVLMTLVSGGGPGALAGSGIGVLLSLALFLTHWTLKNPAQK